MIVREWITESLSFLLRYGFHRYEFAAWESYEDKMMKKRDEEIQKLKDGSDRESLTAEAIVADLRQDIAEKNAQLEAAYKEIAALKASVGE
ncbi:unnamed protein product [Linum tenue]|uniref:Uncharacterized protein n=1 Tax=Linum tenue TaxID=586396 RepID=A0AAV0PSU9_9ROSI|nr:unnamed protein product [Linum tenue]